MWNGFFLHAFYYYHLIDVLAVYLQLLVLWFGIPIASYNGDFVIHFHHPHWREDRNDPATTARR